MTQQLLEYHSHQAISLLSDGDRQAALEQLYHYSELVEGDHELLDVFRERVYNTTGEWLE